LRYYQGIDGLRAIAVTAVVGFHTGLVPGGYVGVDIFFVISGFLMATILNECNLGAPEIKAFILRRFLRLWPLLTFVSLAFSVPYAILTNSNVLAELLPSITFTANLSKPVFGMPSLLGPTWSIATEFQFYLLIAATYWLFSGAPKSILIIACIFYAATTISKFAGVQGDLGCASLAFSPIFRSSGLFLGVILAFAPAVSSRTSVIGVVLAVSMLCLIFPLHTWCEGTSAAVSTLAAEIAAFLLLLALLNENDTLLRRILSAPLLVTLGKLSFGVYLWHYPITWATNQLGSELSFMIVYSISLILAHFSHNYIEQRFYKPRSLTTVQPK